MGSSGEVSNRVVRAADRVIGGGVSPVGSGKVPIQPAAISQVGGAEHESEEIPPPVASPISAAVLRRQQMRKLTAIANSLTVEGLGELVAIAEILRGERKDA